MSARITRSEEETIAAGREVGRTLASGSVLLLSGDLGTGKTAFVRGVAEGLGIDPEAVSSPTFTLVQEYRGGRVKLFHVDLYRLDDPREIEDLGLDELRREGVVAIEWAEKIPAIPEDATFVSLKHGDGNERQLSITATSPAKAGHYKEG